MALLVQRNKGNTAYEAAGYEHPLQVQIQQPPQTPDLFVASHVYVTGKQLVPGIGAAVAYTAGDAFGTKFFFTVPIEGTISNVTFRDFDDEGLRKDLVLFTEDFTATADNAAFAVSDDDLKVCIGVISIDTFYNFGNNQIGVATPAFGYNAPDGRLWCQIVTQGADNIAVGAIPELFMVLV